MQISVEQFLQDANIQAQHTIHPDQDAISIGDCWVRAKDNIGKRIVEFGYVMTPIQVYNRQIRAGANTTDARASAVATVSALDKGYVYGQMFTRRGGEYGLVHKSHIWPISNDVVIAAQAVRWIPEHMSLADRSSIETALRFLRNHTRSL